MSDDPKTGLAPTYLTTEEVATILGCTRNQLALWRRDRFGPAWIKAGSRILYRQDDLLRWIEGRTENPLS
jgi:hypothetical protein